MKTINQKTLLCATDKVLRYLNRDAAVLESYNFNVSALKTKIEQLKDEHFSTPAYPTASRTVRTLQRERAEAFNVLMNDLMQVALRVSINAEPDSSILNVFNKTVLLKQGKQTIVSYIGREFLPITAAEFENLGVTAELRNKVIDSFNRYTAANNELIDFKSENKSNTINRLDKTEELRKLISKASATGKKVFLDTNKAFYSDYKMSSLLVA